MVRRHGYVLWLRWDLVVLILLDMLSCLMHLPLLSVGFTTSAYILKYFSVFLFLFFICAKYHVR